MPRQTRSPSDSVTSHVNTDTFCLCHASVCVSMCAYVCLSLSAFRFIFALSFLYILPSIHFFYFFIYILSLNSIHRCCGAQQ